jgi:hypothetical protein
VIDPLEPLDGDPDVHFSDHVVRSADGVEVNYLDIERAATDRGEASRHLIGIVDLGREALVVDAGGPADSFDEAAVVGFLRSLRLNTGPGSQDDDAASPAAPQAAR